jgi:NADPH2:quinone reductase
MKHTRIVVSRYGGPDAIRVVEEECPEPKAGEVRVRVLASGVSLPDVMAREGIHPETPALPFTPGWDLVGLVDRLGEGVAGFAPGQVVAAMPISGAYAEYVCLPSRWLVPVPAGLDPAEAVSLVLNYITAHQMMHRLARVKPGQRALVHGASGGVGTALLQLGRLAGLEMYGTCSARSAEVVSGLGAVPVDYRRQDWVQEVRRLTGGDGVDVVFDPIGGGHLWESRRALRSGGTVVGYGLRADVRGDGLVSERAGRRRRYGGALQFGLLIAASWILPGRRRLLPYSIQVLARRRPDWFRKDLTDLLGLLREGKVKPIVAQRLPLAEARRAQEVLGQGGVTGKIVLLPGLAAAASGSPSAA